MSVSPASLRLTAGDTARVTASDARVRLIWHSGAPSIATVDGAGLVTALSPGNTSIWGIRDTDSAAVSVQVIGIICAGTPRISPNNTLLAVGDTARVSATLAACAGFNGAVDWSVSDPEVASVTSRVPEGLAAIAVVRALRAGTTVVTARSVDDPTESATMALTVSSP